jgi:DNA-binding CsgD family transcriptional regulator
MSLDLRVSKLIERTYETIVSDEAWDDVLDELLQLTGAEFGLLSAVNANNLEYSVAKFFGCMDAGRMVGLEEYREVKHLTDPSLAFAARNPDARYCDVREIAGPDDEYMKWHRKRLRSPYWIVAWDMRPDGLTFGLSLHPPEGGDLEPDSEALFKMIFDHMVRSVNISSRFYVAGEDNDRALFTLDEHGAVNGRSPAAETILAETDGLSVGLDGKLRCAVPGDHDALQRIIANALAAIETGLPDGSCWIRRLSGRRRRLAKVTALPSKQRLLAPYRPAATVEIVDLTSASPPTHQWLEVFGLSARETEVAELLVQGHSVESLSEMLGISINTARVHLASLFRKTGTNRQTDLVRLLLKVAG